jgi:predicted nucleotidyltransferase
MGESRRDFSEYVDAWRIRLARRELERRIRVQQLREVAQACARRLVQDFGAREVYLFGSLLDEELAHERSDIDLAVEGLGGSFTSRP